MHLHNTHICEHCEFDANKGSVARLILGRQGRETSQ